MLLPAPLLFIATAAALPQEDVQVWREDLTTLARMLEERHIDLYHTLEKKEFLHSVAELEARVPNMERHEIVAETIRIVACVGDGHTRVHMLQDACGFGHLPWRLLAVQDGVLVRSASSEHAELVGATIEAIGGHSIDEVWAALEPYCFRDNESLLRVIVPMALRIPELLNVAGVIAGTDVVPVVFKLEGGELREVELEPGAPEAGTQVQLYGDERKAPHWRKRSGEAHWFELLEDGETLFAQYNACRDEPRSEGGETVGQFARKMERFARERKATRLVLDLRNNDGGNSRLNDALLHAILRLDHLNQPGRLFVLIGPSVFSAAQNFATDLERHTQAIFIGEPTGGRPNQFGELGQFELPGSGLVVNYSALYWQWGGPFDQRPWIPPDIFVVPTADEVRAGRDPCLERALAYVERADVAAVLREELEALGTEEALARCENRRREQTHLFEFDERRINRLGYDLLGSDAAESAVAVLRWNVELFPYSYNAFDSLGEGLVELGDIEGARAAFRRSLELYRDNGNSRRWLERLP